MKFPTNTKPVVWGAVVGAVACMIVGFSWGGWVTGGTAHKEAATAAHAAVVVALAPICADRFRAQGDAPAKIAELAKASSWERGSVVEKSGYALMPGSKTTDSDVVRPRPDDYPSQRLAIGAPVRAFSSSALRYRLGLAAGDTPTEKPLCVLKTRPCSIHGEVLRGSASRQ
jgi:pimeloyl-ACP methyl ester carboxylesterase